MTIGHVTAGQTIGVIGHPHAECEDRKGEGDSVCIAVCKGDMLPWTGTGAH